MRKQPQIRNCKSRAQARRAKKQLEQLARIRGKEREEHFENGGSLVEWRGGTRTVTTDKRKQRNKRACRRKINNFE